MVVNNTFVHFKRFSYFFCFFYMQSPWILNTLCFAYRFAKNIYVENICRKITVDVVRSVCWNNTCVYICCNKKNPIQRTAYINLLFFLHIPFRSNYILTGKTNFNVRTNLCLIPGTAYILLVLTGFKSQSIYRCIYIYILNLFLISVWQEIFCKSTFLKLYLFKI